MSSNPPPGWSVTMVAAEIVKAIDNLPSGATFDQKVDVVKEILSRE